jgi:hypothetical protein
MLSFPWAFGPLLETNLSPRVIPSGARNLLLVRQKSRFLVAALLGMTEFGLIRSLLV